jgi:predicted TIM-barrel fold metal-dependent hydrolase
MDQGMTWSPRESKLVTIAEIEDLIELVEESNGKIVPGVGYNPHRIRESLDRIERAVNEHDFKYVWFQPTSFGMRPTNENCYPLYQKCVELDIPVCMESGQLAYPSTSEPGHPMYAETVAMDFPDLTLVLTHLGWPWVEEWCSMLWRFPNVYGNIGGYYPSFLPEKLVQFVEDRLREKVLWATNGLGIERCHREFMQLPLEAETQRKVLRENAFGVFDLD